MWSVKRTVIRSPQSASAPINFPQHEFSAQLRIHKTSLLCVTLVEKWKFPKKSHLLDKKRPFEANEANWGHFRPSRLFEAIWSHFSSFEVIWDHLRLFEAVWDHLRPFKSIWGYLRPFEAIWGHLKPFEAILSHLRPFEVNCCYC